MLIRYHDSRHVTIPDLPYPLAAPGGIVKIASPKVSHRIAANLMAPSSSLARLPQPPEASFRSIASEWVTPHFLRLPETLGESLQVFGVAAFARVLSFLIEFSLCHSLY